MASLTIDEECALAEPVPCQNCDANCWKAGWLLLPDPAEGEGEEDRQNLCDNCFLFTKRAKGAERRFRGKITPSEPKKDKPKATPKAKKPPAPKAIKKKPPAAKRTLK
jgi:hypothetical protein